ncbi:MAG: hypothetical protein VX777_03735 [Chlamydiota bacterium]|nr:hypothetical protein [Chlamydiota bacterium]
MKKIVFTLMSVMLTATALSANPTVRAKDIENVKIEEQMYTREGSQAKSLAFFSKEMFKKECAQEQEHIEVGTRAMAHNDFVKHQEEVAVEEPEVGKKILDVKEDEIVSKSLGDDEELVAKKIYYNSHDGAYHSPIAVTYFGDEVTLEDGSIWTVASWDQWKTLNWLTTDTILITQNKYLFSSYKFMLVNQATGKEVEVNLSLGPIYSGYYTRWIVAIDYLNDQILLDDGSFWEMSVLDYSITKNWYVNDTVIIGVNESSSTLRPNILINVNMLNYARGICLY